MLTYASAGELFSVFTGFGSSKEVPEQMSQWLEKSGPSQVLNALMGNTKITLQMLEYIKDIKGDLPSIVGEEFAKVLEDIEKLKSNIFGS